LLLFVTQTTKAQLLFSEDFDSYSAGHLISDYTSGLPGRGGWVYVSTITSIMVTPEAGKGNVAVITPNAGERGGAISFMQKNGVITDLWKHRRAGNILKFEYEIYIAAG